MRHVYFRGIIALIWFAAAIINPGTSIFFILIGAMFLRSAWSLWKKEQNDKKDK